MDLIKTRDSFINKEKELRIKYKKYFFRPTYSLYESPMYNELRLPHKFDKSRSILVRIDRYISDHVCMMNFQIDLEFFLSEFDNFIKLDNFVYSIKDYINIGVFQLHKGLIAIQFEGIGIMGFMRTKEIKEYMDLFKNFMESEGYGIENH